MTRIALRIVRRHYPERRAMTLVELLMVLGIVTLLAAVILPSVKNMLSDRKTSQAAIVVKSYIEAARARAIGKNRSVAVVLERISGRAADRFPVGAPDGIINILDADSTFSPPRFVSATSSTFNASDRATVSPDTNFLPYNTCVKLSLAEEPMPITEKSVSIPINFVARSPSDGALPSIPTNYDPAVPLIDPDQAVSGIPEVRIFQVTSTGITADLLGEFLVAGNEISVAESSIRFTIVSPTSRESHDNYATNFGPSTIWFSVLNERGVEGLGELSMNPYIDVQALASTNKFRIFQKPKPIYTQTVQMPKGTCIDLSLSGFANNRPGFSGISGLCDYRTRFASDWVINGSSGVPVPNELRPIYLVFGPDGSFTRVYANQQATSSAVNPQAIRIDVVEDVFLHVGRVDQVAMPVDTVTSTRTRGALNIAVASGAKLNLTDASSYILRLSPKSGAISAAPIRQFVPEATDSFFDIIGKSRSGTLNTTMTGQ